ncbi:PhoH family protein [candidate division KSB1 bacterium]|nr:PhoH family protein [candidate division KSB1 bacterium]
MIQTKIPIRDVDQLSLLGMHDANIRLIEKNFNATFIVRNGEITIKGEKGELELIERLFEELMSLIKRNESLSELDIETTISVLKNNGEFKTPSTKSVPIVLHTKRSFIKPKTIGQERYIESAQKNDIVFVIGPAGTGKTYLAVAIALSYLRDKEVDKIILARPAVEAGESLGFLPGDLKEKVEPYLQPLYDALFDMIAADKMKRYLEMGVIEIVPLAYMRGRTLNNAFVILDEAQNSSANQMKMFLTRLGANARAIITGDITQIDLPNRRNSGLVQIQNILQGIEGIEFIYLSIQDVVRHKLVRKIIQAYDKYDEDLEAKNK